MKRGSSNKWLLATKCESKGLSGEKYAKRRGRWKGEGEGEGEGGGFFSRNGGSKVPSGKKMRAGPRSTFSFACCSGDARTGGSTVSFIMPTCTYRHTEICVGFW